MKESEQKRIKRKLYTPKNLCMVVQAKANEKRNEIQGKRKRITKKKRALQTNIISYSLIEAFRIIKV